MRFSIDEIARITGGDLLVAPLNAQKDVCALTWDSRLVEPGCVYVAIVGARADGNDFAICALRSGAAVALMSRDPGGDERAAARDAGGAIVRVHKGEDAVRALAGAWRDRLSATVVGVTGSVGKTTTKGLLRDVLSSRFRTCATKGNYNNLLGAPYTLLSADEDTQMLVVEMGMDGAGEIARICEIARPHMGIVTNVGLSHLEQLGTRENIARAKAELVEALPEDGTVFLQETGEFTDFIRRHARTAERNVQCVLFGGTPPLSDVYATDIRTDEKGRPSFVLHAFGGKAPCSLSLRGVHNVENALAVAAVALICGMELPEVCAALRQATPEAGRGQLKNSACGAVVFDDAYNASPASMKASLATLSAYKASGRKIAVLGDMGELGEASDSGHYDTGVAAAREGVDLLVCVGELARLIAQGALSCGMARDAVLCTESVQEAIDMVCSGLSEGDVVLVKASRFMGLDRVVEGVVEA